MLSHRSSRELLNELSRAGFARERDIRERQTNLHDVDRVLGDLQSLGLITAEYLLECRQTGHPLARLQNLQQLHGAELGGFVCPNCGAQFSEENVTALYALSELGKRLSESGHWLRVWLTGLLNKLGVPVTSILWLRETAQNESELIVEYLGQLWIISVKDGELSAEDSHRINYRQARYRADRSIALTTDSVSKSAKRVIEESGRLPHAGSAPTVYIEGLEVAEAVFEKEVSAAAYEHARRTLEPIEELSGWHLGPLMAEWLSRALPIRPSESETDTYVREAAV